MSVEKITALLHPIHELHAIVEAAIADAESKRVSRTRAEAIRTLSAICRGLVIRVAAAEDRTPTPEITADEHPR